MGLLPPHAGQLALLQDPQQLGLDRQGQFPHLVEKDGSLVGHFKQAGLALPVGPGEGAPFIAEQFALGQVFGDGAAVDPDEIFLGPGRTLVDVGGDTFLSGAGFALDEDHGVQLGGPAHDPQQVQGGGVLGHHFGGVQDLLPDQFDLPLIAGGELPLGVQGLLQCKKLGDVPHVGDHHADLVRFVVDGGAGDQRPFAGGKGLLYGHGVALVQGHDGGGLGDDALLDQLFHGDAEDVSGLKPGDDLIGAVAPKGRGPLVCQEDAVEGAFQDSHQTLERIWVRPKGQRWLGRKINTVSFDGDHLRRNRIERGKGQALFLGEELCYNEKTTVFALCPGIAGRQGPQDWVCCRRLPHYKEKQTWMQED